MTCLNISTKYKANQKLLREKDLSSRKIRYSWLVLPRYVGSAQGSRVILCNSEEYKATYLHLAVRFILVFYEEFHIGLPKIRIIRKNMLNKSYSALNCLQKIQWAHMSVSPRSEGRGLQRLSSLKYYNVQNRESRFTLGLDAGKKTYYIKKCFN